MDALTLAAFVCYLVSAMGSIAFGFIYLTRSEFMPYHREALGQNWDQLDKRLQTLIIALMRAIGGGLLGGSPGVLVLLFIPFQSGESWSYYAIPAIGLITYLPSFYAILIVRLRTRAVCPYLETNYTRFRYQIG
jgi:hypothetical protein